MDTKQLRALELVIREHEQTHSDGKWAIGDKLIEICGPPGDGTANDGSYQKIAACAEYLAQREFEESYNLSRLIELREIAHNFSHPAHKRGAASWGAYARAYFPDRMERIVELAKKKGVKVTIAFVDEYLAKIKADLEAEARKEKERAEKEREEAEKRAKNAQNDKERERAEKEREEADKRRKEAEDREKRNRARPKPKPNPKPAPSLVIKKNLSEISLILEQTNKLVTSYLSRANIDEDVLDLADSELVEILNQTKELLDMVRKAHPHSSNLRVVK